MKKIMLLVLLLCLTTEVFAESQSSVDSYVRDTSIELQSEHAGFCAVSTDYNDITINLWDATSDEELEKLAVSEYDKVKELNIHLRVNRLDPNNLGSVIVQYYDGIKTIANGVAISEEKNTSAEDNGTNKGNSSETTASATSPSVTVTPEPEKIKLKHLNLGDIVFTEKYHFTLGNVEYTKAINAPNTNAYWYDTFEADPGESYIHISGYFYNPTPNVACVRDLPIGIAVYDDNYKYLPINGRAFSDDFDSNFIYKSTSYVVADPLQTCNYHCAISVPDQVVNSDKPLYVAFPMADGNTYVYVIRGTYHLD